MTALDIRGLCRSYGRVAALADVALHVPSGSRTAVVGPSGSGKTTLLRLIAGFEAPDAGRILLGDTLLADGPDAVPAHRRGIGIVMQDGALFPHLDIGGNIAYGLDARGPARARRIAELMELVGLEPALAARRPDQVSGGQQQRVALARALARRPRLMLLDEPFSALDTGLRESTRRAVADMLHREGITTILVTHDQGEALSFADQVAVMRGGRLLQAGTPRDLYRRPADPMIATFLGDAIILAADAADGQASCVLGRLPLCDGAAATRPGPARIMIRPEQVVLGPATGTGARGEVVEAEFGGAVCSVEVRLADGSRIKVRTSAFDVPTPGTAVGLSIRGEVHAFPG